MYNLSVATATILYLEDKKMNINAILSFIKELLEHLSEFKAAGIIDLIVKLIQSIFGILPL